MHSSARVKKNETRSLMKAIGLSLIMVAVLSGGAYLACHFILEKSSFRFTKMASGKIHTNVLVAGNSRGVNLLLGNMSTPDLKIFNISFNGLGQAGTLATVKAFFAAGNTADTVLIETTALFTPKIACDMKPYWTMYPILKAAQTPGCPQDIKAAKFMPLTQFNSEIFYRVLFYATVHYSGDQDWGDHYTIAPDKCHRLPNGVTDFARDSAAADPKQVRTEIRAFRHWLTAHGYHTKVYFVFAPVLAEPAAMPVISGIDRINRETFDAGHYINLSTALGQTCANFADTIHVGDRGRNILKNHLVPILSAMDRD